MGNYFSACNIAHPASLPKFDKNTKHTVHIADNVDFIDGNITRRSGFTSVAAMTGAHSLHATDTTMYFVRGGKLYRVATVTPYTEVELFTLSSNNKVAWERFNGSSYLSNGVDALVLNETTHALDSWLVDTPANPTTAVGAGSLNPGKYRIAVSQRNNTSGRRSPVSTELVFDLSVGGITVTLPALETGMTHNDVFMSDANGGTLYYQTTSAAASVLISSFSNTGRALPQHRRVCLPAGTILRWFKGRLLSAKDKVLSFSDAYWPTMTDGLKGYVPFPDDITEVMPVETGVWVGTLNAQYFFEGLEPAKWVPKTVKDSGVAAGSGFHDEETKLSAWYDNDGVRLLNEGGEADSPQFKVFAPKVTTAATCFFDRRTENLIVMSSGTEATNKREHAKYSEFKSV